MGEDAACKSEEIAALQLGLDLGMTLIDTAEMYGSGGAEEITGAAIAGRRDEVFLVSKVLPQNASRKGTVRACEDSLRRLGVDKIDLYLLHWEGVHPLAETLAAFERLAEEGKIGSYGVSNFDVPVLRKALEISEGATHGPLCANQILYNLLRRGAEHELLPLCQERGIAFMAYSPFDQASLGQGDVLAEVAHKHDATPYQIALAWVLREEAVIAIPKATNAAHVRANAEALTLTLDEMDVRALDEAFPRPGAGAGLEWN